MEETGFYVLGITVVVVALVVTAIGLRWDRFPGSRAGAAAVGVFVAALVVATGAFAWMHSTEEQHEHAAEHAEERAQAAEERRTELADQFAAAEGETGLQESGGEGEEGEEPPQDIDGQQVFDAAGCGGCHTLEAAGSSATVGPNLDEQLPGQSAAEIEESIVDPEAATTQGFQPGTMPPDFGEQLSQAEIDALVTFLSDNAS